MAIAQRLTEGSEFDTLNWDRLLHQIYADSCFDTSRSALCEAWIKQNLTASGPTMDGIQCVKDFDAYLASDLLTPVLTMFGLPPRSSDCDPFHLRALRQLLRIGWKINTGVLPEKESTLLAACRRIAVSGRHDPNSIYFHRAKRAIHNLFSRIPVPPISSLNLRFGPGTTAEGLRVLPEKLERLQWCAKWQPYVSASDLVFTDEALLSYRFEALKRGVTKCVCVPKDARGPRVISEEPNTFMLLQQGIWRFLRKALLIEPQIEFEDQGKHRNLLCDPEYSSLDLSDASDYVSRRLIWQLFPREWAQFLFAFRSSFIASDGVLYPIRAFAPMGSALCFPVEAIVHWAAVKAAQEDLPRSLRKKFSVYGDDIIVHSAIAGSVMTALRSLGLNPNLRKCFINRPFRESCGLDLFLHDGRAFDVTPAYVRSPLRKHSNTQDLLQLCLVQNHLYEVGLKEASDFLMHYILKQCPGLPQASHRCLAGALLLCESSRITARFNRGLQRLEVRTIVLEPKTSQFELYDYLAAFAILGMSYESNALITGVNRPVWRHVPLTCS